MRIVSKSLHRSGPLKRAASARAHGQHGQELFERLHALDRGEAEAAGGVTAAERTRLETLALQERDEALRRLEELIERVAAPPKDRRPTRPTRASVARRLEGKARRASVKAARGRVSD